MKFIHALFFFFMPLAVLYADQAPTYIFYVSPTGSDANPGTEAAPFKTLQQAQNVVRLLPDSAYQNQDVYILLRGGTYRMQEPLVLNWTDSGRKGNNVVYRAYPGETPVVSGAIQVPGPWTNVAGIWHASVPVGTATRQLYVNGNRAQRARTTFYPAGFRPNYTPLAPATNGIEYIQAPALNPPAWVDPTMWTNQADIEAVIITQWKMMRVPVSSISTTLITMQEPAWTNANIYVSPLTLQPAIWAFWQVTWFENALQFLTQPGQWYLDSAVGTLYYMPLPGEDITTADVELPVLETLVTGLGDLEHAIQNIRFEGITFSYATWLAPSTNNGYVADQSGFLVVGTGHQPTIIGHDPNLVPTPGNLQFSYAHEIVFTGNIFQHLGAVGLQFDTGSQNNRVEGNLFTDISSAAMEFGGISSIDHHPTTPGQLVKNNLIKNNLVNNVAVDYVDAAGIFVGFSQKTTISHNTITNVPWSGIAMGWGWGLWDRGSFPGLPHAYSGEWGAYNTLTPNEGCLIHKNRIDSFLNTLWDGGAIYTTGRQGPSKEKGLLIKGNVASGKRPAGGGNAFYTDGGSRCIRVEENVSFNNPIGITYFGPPPNPMDPLPYPDYSIGNGVPYGCDTGGCVTFGDIHYEGNYILQTPMQSNIPYYNFINHTLAGVAPYSYHGFFAICTFTYDGISYPKDLTYKNNHPRFSLRDVPAKLLKEAGVQERPSTIPAELWILPSP